MRRFPARVLLPVFATLIAFPGLSLAQKPDGEPEKKRNPLEGNELGQVTVEVHRLPALPAAGGAPWSEKTFLATQRALMRSPAALQKASPTPQPGGTAQPQ